MKTKDLIEAAEWLEGKTIDVTDYDSKLGVLALAFTDKTSLIIRTDVFAAGGKKDDLS